MLLNNNSWDLKTYNNLISKGKTRGLNKGELDYYTEKHHIIPKCMGGTNDESNLVLLTAREHIIAHMLLSCIYPDNEKLLSSVTKMFSEGKTTRKEGISKISTRLLSRFKEEYSKIQLGKHLEKSHIMNLSKSHRGVKLSEETKDKLKESRFSVQVLSPDGRVFESITECSINYGIPQTTLKNWIRYKPERGFKIIGSTGRASFKRRVQGPDGKIYSSIKECAKDLKRNDKTIKNWIEKHPELGFKFI